MESPKRRALKSRDYRRHRMMRLLNRRKATAQEAMSEIAERELMRRLRITPLKKFEDGKDAEYDAGVLDDVIVTGNRRPANIMFDKNTGNYYRESTGDVVTPVNKLVEDNPSTWSFTDKNGTTFTPHGPVFNSNQGEIRLAEEAPFLSNNYIKQAAHNYMSELAYDINNNRVVGGKYTMPAIALAPVLSNPVGEAAINSAFAAHGLNHAVNEGVDGIGDAILTGLEIAPLGQLIKPAFNVSKNALVQLSQRHDFSNPDIRYNIVDSDFESFTIPTEELQTSLNAPINNPVVINGKEYPTMKALMNKVEMIKPDELNAAHLLAQKEIRMYLESPEYRQRLIDNGFDPDKYIPALEHYLGSRVKYGDLGPNTNGVTEIVNGKPEITLNSSVFDTDYDTLVHELAHALTKNLDHSMYVKSFIDARLKDIMLYNETILPQLDRNVAAQSGISINRLTYLNDPQEIRARMIAIIMDARRKGIKLNEYIDRVKSNRLLNDLKSFLKVEDIKKYGADILAVTPFAIPFAKKNKQKGVK